jgi:hypothetical protein
VLGVVGCSLPISRCAYATPDSAAIRASFNSGRFGRGYFSRGYFSRSHFDAMASTDGSFTADESWRDRCAGDSGSHSLCARRIQHRS